MSLSLVLSNPKGQGARMLSALNPSVCSLLAFVGQGIRRERTDPGSARPQASILGSLGQRST